MKSLYILLLAGWCFSGSLYGQNLYLNIPTSPVIINEIAVVPLKKTHPKWVELRNVTNDAINLSGWSLHDSQKCLYTFKKSEELASGALLIILFYESKNHENEKRDFQFEQSIPPHVRKILVFNTRAYNAERELHISVDKLEEASKGEPWWTNMIDEAHPENKGCLTPSQFAELEGRAKKYLKDNSLPDKYLAEVMFCLMRFIPCLDEIALQNSDKELVAYISWGSIGTQKEIKLKYEEEALEKELLKWRTTFTGFPSDNSITLPQIIFERDPTSRGVHYSRVRFGSPGILQNKPKKKQTELLYTGRIDLDSISIPREDYDTFYPMWMVVQFSSYKNFNEVEHVVSGKEITRLTQHLMVPMDMDMFRLALKNNETWFRAKRILCTGEETDWVYCEKPIKWVSICSHFKVDNVEGLIRLWHEKQKEKKSKPIH